MTRAVSNVIALPVSFRPVACPECCVTYALPRALLDRLRRDKRTTYCPNGHKQFWTPTSEEKRR